MDEESVDMPSEVGDKDVEIVSGPEILRPSSSNNNGLPKKEIEEIFEPSAVIKQGRSLCWKFFFFKGTKEKGAVTTRVFCKLCPSQSPGLSYNNSTTSLTDHVKRHHKIEFEKAEKEAREKNNNKPENQIKNYFGPKATNVYKWPKTSQKWKATTEQLAKWLCTASRPSAIVEDQGFIDFMAMVVPEYEVPCDQTMTNYIWRMYEEKKNEIKEKLSKIEDCALTSDGGTSTNAVSFQDTNVHYIDEDLYLQYHTLAVDENKEKHDAANYRANTDKVTEEFEITEKVVLNVTDNENKMKCAFKKEERSGCTSHILHSSVSSAMEKVGVVKTITKKVRKISKRHNKSYAFRYGLQVQQKKLGIKVRPLKQDVPTRWGSTRASTASFLDAKEKVEEEEDGEEKMSEIFGEELDTFRNADAINAALRDIKFKKKSEREALILSRSDMLKIKNLNTFLTKLDIYSTTLGGSTFVTASIVLPVVKSLQKHLEADEEDPRYIAEMKEIILEDFKERVAENLNLPILLKATALDPRFMNLKVVGVKEEREQVFEEIEKELKERASKKTNEVSELEDKGEKVKKRKLCLDFDESDEESDDGFDEIKKELENYRHESLQPREEDPLDWWRKRKARYPHLVGLVRKYLCIPATSTQAERVFSALGLLLTKRRLCMSGSNVCAQLFLKDNMKS